jgi:hypothetical protein
MSDIAILKEMLKPESTLALDEHQNGRRLNYSVTLKESSDNYSVKIEGMPKHEDVIVINPESFNPSTILNAANGQCKRADFVIVADTDLEKMVICIEMKKTKDENKKIIQQLNGAKCFVAYCREIGKAFWGQQNFLDAYQYRFIRIGRISISKRTTRLKKKVNSELHDTPEKMLKIVYQPVLQFNYLVEGEE